MQIDEFMRAGFIVSAGFGWLSLLLIVVCEYIESKNGGGK